MNIYQKLLEVKMKVPYMKKDKKGYNYTYTTPSQVFATINPILNEIGLLLVTNVIESKSYPIEVPTKNGPKTEWKYDLDFIFDWVDVDTEQKLSIPWKASGVNGEDKGLGSALTYAERYFILKQFNIPTDDDDPDAFQSKYATDEEKQHIQAEKTAKEKEEKDKRDLAAKVALDKLVTDAIGKIPGCKTVADLTALKKSVEPSVTTNKIFSTAAMARYNEIKPVATA
jgi:hypothetical protein